MNISFACVLICLSYSVFGMHSHQEEKTGALPRRINSLPDDFRYSQARSGSFGGEDEGYSFFTPEDFKNAWFPCPLRKESSEERNLFPPNQVRPISASLPANGNLPPTVNEDGTINWRFTTHQGEPTTRKHSLPARLPPPPCKTVKKSHRKSHPSCGKDLSNPYALKSFEENFYPFLEPGYLKKEETCQLNRAESTTWEFSFKTKSSSTTHKNSTSEYNHSRRYWTFVPEDPSKEVDDTKAPPPNNAINVNTGDKIEWNKRIFLPEQPSANQDDAVIKFLEGIFEAEAENLPGQAR